MDARLLPRPGRRGCRRRCAVGPGGLHDDRRGAQHGWLIAASSRELHNLQRAEPDLMGVISLLSNARRPHTSLGGLAPDDFAAQSQQPAQPERILVRSKGNKGPGLEPGIL